MRIVIVVRLRDQLRDELVRNRTKAAPMRSPHNWIDVLSRNASPPRPVSGLMFANARYVGGHLGIGRPEAHEVPDRSGNRLRHSQAIALCYFNVKALCYAAPCYCERMAPPTKTPGDRLREARLRAGFLTIADAARATRLHPQNWADHEAGRRKISLKHALTYGAKLFVSPFWILTGQELGENHMIPIMGYVGVEAEVHSIGPDDLEAIQAPIGAQRGDVAYLIREASIPSFAKGGIIVARPVKDPEEALHRPAVIELENGRRYFRYVSRGSGPGRWTLYGPRMNNAPIPDAKIVSVAILRVYLEPE